MKLLHPLLRLLAVLIATASLSACYGYDPIKDKLNQLNNSLQNDNGETAPSTPEGLTTFDLTFSFEQWPDVDAALPAGEAGFSSTFWASASNDGFKAIPNQVLPYPVTPAAEGYEGRCVRMLTRPGMKFAGMGSYLVAASLFSGKVDISQLVLAPLEATYFGHIVHQRPVRMRGYYRYTAGPKLIDGSVGPDAMLEGRDSCTIAGIFYEVTLERPYLNGKNLYTAPSIVALARMKTDDTDGWQPFDLVFQTVGNTPVDLTKKKYRLALVFASSARGDEYIGAVDSELLIDELTLTLTTRPE